MGEGRISTRGTSVRNSGEGWCQRHDNRQDIGGTCHVILNLFQDLAAVTQRKAPLPTLSPRGRGVVEPRQHIELSCHCEAERSEAVAIAKSLELNGITTSSATPRNDMKIICHYEALAEGSQDNPPTLTLPLKGGRENFVSEAHRKELNVLKSYRLNDFKKKAAFTLAEGATHVDMSGNIRRVAFTLAEVLITLGIIGVVAAMTIPTISHNIQQAVLKNQFKKFYSTFWQAVIGTQTKEGRPLRCYYWDGTNPYTGKCTATCDEDDKNQYGNCKTGTYYCKETGENLPADFNGMYSDCSVFHEELFLNTLKTTKICKDHAYEQGCLPEDFRGANIVQSEQNPDKEYDPNGIFSDSSVKNNYPVFVLADGTYIIEYYAYLGGIPLYVFDINGHKGPNKWGYDIFGVELQGNNKNGISKLQGAYFALEEGGKTFQQMYDEAFN